VAGVGVTLAVGVVVGVNVAVGVGLGVNVAVAVGVTVVVAVGVGVSVGVGDGLDWASHLARTTIEVVWLPVRIISPGLTIVCTGRDGEKLVIRGSNVSYIVGLWS
jgi:hypothetical protein